MHSTHRTYNLDDDIQFTIIQDDDIITVCHLYTVHTIVRLEPAVEYTP